MAIRTPHKGNPVINLLRRKAVMIPLICILTILTLWAVFAFSTIPFIASLRTIWIETAMTTADHQWLATAFLPKSTIDKVVSTFESTQDVIGGKDHLTPSTGPADTQPDETQPGDTGPADTEPVAPPVGPGTPADPLDQKNLVVGQPDYAGYTVLINDIEQGIVVSEITGSTTLGAFKGQIMLIDDPSRVFLGTTTMKGKEGLRIRYLLSHYDAVAGINASGFPDPDNKGTGGDPIGLTYADGEFWGTQVDYYGAVLMTNDNRLVVGDVRDWENYDIRAGIQFGPVIMADGEPVIEGTGGWGYHPRTVIGQREDGVIVFLVIDGRVPGWSSFGCSMAELSEILAKYEVVNAACCDGGSSSVLAYNGEVINHNSSQNPTHGRRLPNAWLVAPKVTEEE